MNFTLTEQAVLKQAVELLASRTSTKEDEGNVIVLPDETHALLQKVLSPTTIILSESLAETHVEKNVTVATAVERVRDEVGMLTANYDNVEANAFVHFAGAVSHPFVDHVIETLAECNEK